MHSRKTGRRTPNAAIYLVLLLPLVLNPATAAGQRADWPQTLEQAVARLIAGLADEDRRRVRETPRAALIQYHHGWGTGIRNDFGLWQGNLALIESACGKPCHPDDASMAIIVAVWRRLNDAP